MSQKYQTKPVQPCNFTPTEAAFKRLEESFDKARKKDRKEGDKSTPLDFVEVTEKK